MAKGKCNRQSCIDRESPFNFSCGKGRQLCVNVGNAIENCHSWRTDEPNYINQNTYSSTTLETDRHLGLGMYLIGTGVFESKQESTEWQKVILIPMLQGCFLVGGNVSVLSSDGTCII